MAEYLKSLPPDSSLAHGPRRARSDEGARRAALHRQLQRLPPGARPRRPGVFPPLAGNPVVLAADPEQHPQGRRSRHSGARNGFIAMPAFNTQLTDQQVAEIANYVRTSWGNSAPPNATSAMVAKLRAGPN